VLWVFVELGLVRMDDPRPPYIAAADDAGLLRVMQVGLQEYAESRGVSVTGPSQRGRTGTERLTRVDYPLLVMAHIRFDIIL